TSQLKTDTLAPALEYMESHYQDEIDIPRLARLCMTGLRNFQMTFKRATNQTPTGYWNRLRIKTATNLLSSSTYPIIEIAGLVGYRTLSNFNSHFIRDTGLPPRQWRKKYSLRHHKKSQGTGPHE